MPALLGFTPSPGEALLGSVQWPEETETCLLYLGEKQLAVEEVGELHQALFHRLSPTLRHIQVPLQWRLTVAWEEDALCIGLVVQEGNPGANQITGEIHHLCHEVWKERKRLG